eukprot:40021-Amphidinium_carterae.1
MAALLRNVTLTCYAIRLSCIGTVLLQTVDLLDCWQLASCCPAGHLTRAFVPTVLGRWSRILVVLVSNIVEDG